MIPLLFGAPLIILLIIFLYYGREADKMFEKEREEYQN